MTDHDSRHLPLEPTRGIDYSQPCKPRISLAEECEELDESLRALFWQSERIQLIREWGGDRYLREVGLIDATRWLASRPNRREG